ncbi:hypothetical protein ACFY2V_18920 [Streptomyces eurythermus]|uniref:hypothetical protein n=1 Tax=Streptomyces eurythermus TaxID=42237 RepID=UPI0036C71A52
MLARVREPGEYADQDRSATLTESVPGVPAQRDTPGEADGSREGSTASRCGVGGDAPSSGRGPGLALREAGAAETARQWPVRGDRGRGEVSEAKAAAHVVRDATARRSPARLHHVRTAADVARAPLFGE